MRSGELYLVDDQARVTRGFVNGLLFSIPAWWMIAVAARFF